MAKRTKKELRGPKIVAIPPGPKSKAAMARKEKFVTNAVKVALPIDVTFAEGPFVQDADGNVYVDLGGGIGVQTAGHRPPSVIRAAKGELDRLTHISFMVATYAPYTDLAARMAEICPPGLTKSIFLNSGSEAIENAVKISRAATKRAWLVSFKTAFHGRTLLDISLTGKDKPYRDGFGPLVREVILADYAYPYRDPQGRPPAECAKARVEEIERLINRPEAAGLGAIDVSQKALPKTKKLEALIRKRLDEIFEGHDRVGEVRGIGAMWALEFVKDRRTKEPDVELARAVQLAGLKNGLVLLTAGFFNNCIRLLPPINIPLPLMAKALDLLEDSLDLALAGKAA